MIYRLKNVSAVTFAFEGVTLAAGAESHDLEPEVYQRLLALYYPDTLRPAEGDGSFQGADPEPKADVAAEPEKAPEVNVDGSRDETLPPENKPEGAADAPAQTPATFTCPDHADKTFSTQKALNMHVRMHKAANADGETDA